MSIRIVGEAEVRAGRNRVRGDDVPGQATPGEPVEGEADDGPSSTGSLNVEDNVPIRPRCSVSAATDAEDDARLKCLATDAVRDAHATPVRRPGTTRQFSPLGELRHPNVVTRVCERRGRLAGAPPCAGVDTEVEHVHVQDQLTCTGHSRPPGLGTVSNTVGLRVRSRRHGYRHTELLPQCPGPPIAQQAPLAGGRQGPRAGRGPTRTGPASAGPRIPWGGRRSARARRRSSRPISAAPPRAGRRDRVTVLHDECGRQHLRQLSRANPACRHTGRSPCTDPGTLSGPAMSYALCTSARRILDTSENTPVSRSPTTESSGQVRHSACTATTASSVCAASRSAPVQVSVLALSAMLWSKSSASQPTRPCAA